jgi:hypothetical protein
VVFVKGFSCLNTDDRDEFAAVSQRIGTCLKPGGVGLYWAQTDLSGSWTQSNWFHMAPPDLNQNFGPGRYVLLYRPFIQSVLPKGLNLLFTRALCRLPGKLSRPAELFGVLCTGGVPSDA